VAGVYDYYLGGNANSASDRQFGNTVMATFPLVRLIALANRIFLHRAVRHLMRLGIRQFVDVGSGMPTMGNTHAIAEEFDSGAATVVYVDNDPGTVAHSRFLIGQTGDPARHAVIHADLRDPDRLWQRVADTGLIQLTEPVALLFIAVLHIRQLDGAGRDVAPRSLARYRELLSHGSYLALSHATKEHVPDHIGAKLSDLGPMYAARISQVRWRSRDDIAQFFGDFELLPPGITWTPLWHPEESAPGSPVVTFTSPGESAVLAGIGRKP
jgi:hypothetical protein